jgi:hypothetical protein
MGSAAFKLGLPPVSCWLGTGAATVLSVPRTAASRCRSCTASSWFCRRDEAERYNGPTAD